MECLIRTTKTGGQAEMHE